MNNLISETKLSPKKPTFSARLGRYIDRLALGSGYISSGIMIICALLITFDIFSRMTNHPSTWGPDITTYLVVVLVFLSLAEGLRSDSHIRADLLIRWMNPRMQTVMSIAGSFFITLSSGIFGFYAFLWAKHAIITQERNFGFTRMVLWPVKLLIAVGFILMTLMALKLLVVEIRKLADAKGETFGSGINNPYIVIPGFLVLLVISVILLNVNPALGVILLLLTMLASGTPIAFSILTVALSTLYFTFNGAGSVAAAPAMAYEFINRYTLLALPMFIFAGNVMANGGLGEDIFNLAKVYVGHIPGGLGIAVIIASTIFGALSGSSVACALTIGSVAYPILVANGYSKGLAAGLIATAGGIGILIPPSNAFITYGLIASVPIGNLFIAGVIPGLLMGLVLSLITVLLVMKSNTTTKLAKASWKERIRVTRKSLGAIFMPVLVLGGIYSGLLTVTEASAVAAIYSVLYSFFARSLDLKKMGKVLYESIHSVAFLLLIMMSAVILSKCVTMLRLPDLLMASLGDTPGWAIILIMMVFCIFLGGFLEGVAITTLTVPVIAPILVAYGFDLVWYGILLTVNMTLAAVTPPVGLNLFVMQRIGNLSAGTVVKGTLVFFVGVIVLLAIIGLFPQLSLWLPAQMK